MKNKIILTDCDGVLLDWEQTFHIWMTEHGFNKVDGGAAEYSISKRYGISEAAGKHMVEIFNESATIGFLPPLRDAVEHVKKLHKDHGYVFHCITSLTDDIYAQKLRKMNLEETFGKGIFTEYIFLDTGQDKDEALLPYKDSECWWIEDKIANCQVGTEMGLKSILVAHKHNEHFKNPRDIGYPNVPRVAKWATIYKIITGHTSP